jgi:hypothetical protein
MRTSNDEQFADCLPELLAAHDRWSSPDFLVRMNEYWFSESARPAATRNEPSRYIRGRNAT